MSNSSLVTYTKLSPNCNKPRNHVIDTITIHCFVGQVTAKRGCEVFANPLRLASANYIVGYDGSIGLCVEEANRSWCTSSRSNDHRAITIEVASETKAPYTVTKKAFDALIELVTDICKRNNIKELKWKGDKKLVGNVDKQNMTVHRWFANKACPGDYLYNRHDLIASEVNRRLNPVEEPKEQEKVVAEFTPYRVRVSISNLRIRKGAGTNTQNMGYIKPGVYTIVEERNGTGATKWGKLKSGAGWISLDYCKKV